VFAEFIQAGHLRADQMTCINNIISYMAKNGTIETKILFEPLFTNIHDQGVFDDAQVTNAINLIDRVNKQCAGEWFFKTTGRYLTNTANKSTL
jgi:type I restriction enzyme R subunit